MKKIIIFLSLILCCNVFFAQKLNVDAHQATATKIDKIDDNHFVINAHVKDIDYEKIAIDGENYLQLSIPGYFHSGEYGEPMLPRNTVMFDVPMNVDVKIKVTYDGNLVVHQLSNDVLLMPMQRPVPKSGKAPDFIKSATAYSQDRDFVLSPAVEEVGVMRFTRYAAINYSPIAYNPVANTVSAFSDIRIEVEFVNNPNRAAAVVEVPHSYDVYQIIAPRMFESTLQPLIAWKTKKGFKVQVAYTEDIGTSTTAIKTYLTGLYNNAANVPAPNYVLLCGDVAQIPVFPANSASYETDHITDLYYMEYTGDYLPDVMYGRMSATTTAELANQINKTLAMEKLTMSDLSFLGKSTLIAGIDSPHQTMLNRQMDYARDLYFNTANGITNTHFSPAISSNSTQIVANINEGRGFVNYTAHGYDDEWSSPNINSSMVNSQLNNVDKYPVMIGNCCLSGKFNSSMLCFGEALLRKANAGAVIYIGATNSTFFSEDMWWGVGNASTDFNSGSAPTYNSTGIGEYDALFHTHGEAYDKWANCASQYIKAGNMAVQASSSSAGMKRTYWEIYTCFGDPSYTHYLGVPTEQTPVIPAAIPFGVPTFEATVQPYAYVGLTTPEGQWVAGGYADASGNVELEMADFVSPMLDIVITAPNKKPYFGSIVVSMGNTAYLGAKNFVFKRANTPTTNIGFDDNLSMEFDIQNYSPDKIANNLSLQIISSNPSVVVENNFGTLTTLASSTTVHVSGQVQITSGRGLVDGEEITFHILLNHSDTAQQEASTSLTGAAPYLTPFRLVLDDSQSDNDGVFTQGETVVATMIVKNIGTSAIPAANINITCTESYINISNASTNLKPIPVNGFDTISATITCSESAADYSAFAINVSVSFGSESFQAIGFVGTVGALVENFETGVATMLFWEDAGSEWEIANTGANGTNYSLKSKPNVNNGIKTLTSAEFDCLEGEISFYYKTSTEPVADKLRFYIEKNGSQQVKGTYHGNKDWTQVTFPVSDGVQRFVWKYEKDGSGASGEDAVWIDEIRFPQAQNIATNSEKVVVDKSNFDVFCFNGVITFRIDSKQRGNATLFISNILGQQVAMVAEKESLAAGQNNFYFNANNLSEGVYICTYFDGKTIQSKKIVLN